MREEIEEKGEEVGDAGKKLCEGGVVGMMVGEMDDVFPRGDLKLEERADTLNPCVLGMLTGEIGYIFVGDLL